MRRAALYGLFFLSGVSSLIYELAWQRLLTLVFGVSTLSVGAVLAGFLGGLALGSLLFGRLADRTRHPLRVYACFEVGVGVIGLLVPPGFAALSAIYPVLHANLAAGAWGGTLLRFGLSLLVLVIPATLLGATLPIMGRLALRRTAGPECDFSLFYGVNTLGGVAGAALAGLVMLRYLGLQQTLWVAAILNSLVAIGAAALSKASSIQEQADMNSPMATAPAEGNQGARLTLVCAALTGAVCTCLEVTWSRILGILTSNSAYGFTLLLTVLLLGLSLGSLLQAWLSRRSGSRWRRLAICQWLLAAVTLASAPRFRTTPEWLARWCESPSGAPIFLSELALTAAALFLPSILMGMSLPLLVAAGSYRPERFGRWLGGLYAANTVGCTLGPFAAGFVLIPWLGIRGTLGVCVAATILVGLIAWLRVARIGRWLTASAVIASAGVAWFMLSVGPFLKSPVEEPRRLLYYREGDSAIVAVVEEPTGARTIMVDGQPVAGTSGTSVVDQKMLAHLPLLLHPQPRHALTVGFGSGGTSYSMALHNIDVDCVEIEACVPAAAEHFHSENHGVLSHPRFQLIRDDARSWLRVARTSYDVIVTDCTNLQYRSNGDLYTTDYFRLMRNRLSGDGVAAAWVPANGIRGEDLRTLMRSFRAVFPHTSVWFMNTLPTDFLIVVGTPKGLSIDLDDWGQRIQAPEVYLDLAAVGLADPYRLACTLLCTDEKLGDYLGEGNLNTDNRPVLSYSTYGSSYRATIAANLVELIACRVDPAKYLVHPAPSTILLRHYAASNEALLGHLAHWSGREDAALAHYLSGGLLIPQDSAFRALVRSAYECQQASPLHQ
jgi:spermidine synthase